MTNTFTGITLRFAADTMRGKAGAAKGRRTAVCLGYTEGKGWTFIPTTTSFAADWQQPINQTRGWKGWDLRYRFDNFWTPNMVFNLSDEDVEAAMAEDGRIGWAPQDVVEHGREELFHALDNGLMTRKAWFAQPGLRRQHG